MNTVPDEASPPHTDLHRGLGVIGIVFMVVAAAAPITVVAANFPIIISVSGSLGAPLMILVATVILLLFAVGFSWMTPHVPDAGAFYSYIDRGLGRRAGLGAASIALFSYVLLTVSMTCYLGVQTGNLIELWTGTSLPWWLISAVASTWVSIVTSAIVLVSAVLQLDPVMQIYTWYSGAGALGVIVMMTLTSFAVVGYGSKLRGVAKAAPSATVTAAAVLGGVGLLLVLGISVWNFPVLVGGTVAAIVWGLVLVAAYAAGMLVPSRVGTATEDQVLQSAREG